MILLSNNLWRDDNLGLKNQVCTPLGCKDLGIRKFEFVAETQFLFLKMTKLKYILTCISLFP